MGTDIADPTVPEIRVCAEKCSTCIFRPGNLMHLRPGRVKEMVAEARRTDGHIVCHSTLDPDVPGAICAGYADLNPDCLPLTVGRRLDCLVPVHPPSIHDKANRAPL